jgi:hypothetical protein
MGDPGSSGVFIKKFGEHRVGEVLVTVTPTEKQLIVGRVNASGTLKPLPSAWIAQPGWFVFVGQGDVWAYDGRDELILVRQVGTEQSTTLSIFNKQNFPIAVPEPVLGRLKEPFRSQMSTGR